MTAVPMSAAQRVRALTQRQQQYRSLYATHLEERVLKLEEEHDQSVREHEAWLLSQKDAADNKMTWGSGEPVKVSVMDLSASYGWCMTEEESAEMEQYMDDLTQATSSF